MNGLTVVKVGGNEIDDPAFLSGLCAAIAQMPRPLILVHGGGKEISAALDRAGLPVEFVEGLRVTSPEAMTIMQSVVCGIINQRVVAALVSADQPAIGLSGHDLQLLGCRPLRPKGRDIGRVGEVTQVRAERLAQLLDNGFLPVFAPVARGIADGLSYNVNADLMAEAVAVAMQASQLVFVSNVPGVLRDGALVPQLTALQVEAFIADGVISGGMIPKVRSAIAALGRGAAAVRITNLAGLAVGSGTVFSG
jgi:acetylglutamate kinase